MDGHGYPRRVTGDAIPIQTRMMTISDIYDALTAQDRPYKKAVPRERALDILTQEVKIGQLDTELFRLFVAAKVFEVEPSKKSSRAATNIRNAPNARRSVASGSDTA